MIRYDTIWYALQYNAKRSIFAQRPFIYYSKFAVAVHHTSTGCPGLAAYEMQCLEQRTDYLA